MWEKNFLSRLDQCFAVIAEPHVVHYSVCKAVDGTHFERDLITGAPSSARAPNKQSGPEAFLKTFLGSL